MEDLRTLHNVINKCVKQKYSSVDEISLTKEIKDSGYESPKYVFNVHFNEGVKRDTLLLWKIGQYIEILCKMLPNYEILHSRVIFDETIKIDYIYF